MGEFPSKKKSKRLMLVAAAIIVVLFASAVLYFLYVGTPATSELHDPSNDVVLSVGTQYPGMIDVVSAALKVNGTTLNVTINGRDPVSNLGDGEYAQWNVTLILENDTDVLKTYMISVNMNSNQLLGSVTDMDGGAVETCQVSYYKNSLTVIAVINELSATKKIEWNILSTYERYSGDELTTSASDLAPDEGLQQTIIVFQA